MMPFVSVIVPVRNGEGTVHACLEALLAQDYPRDCYEVLVVDNDSTDRTADVIRQYPVRYLAERETHSPAAARNRGIREARGELLALIDADCVAVPQWLRAGLSAFHEEGVGGAAGPICGYRSSTLAQRYVDLREAFSQRWALTEAFKPFAQTGNAFYRKAVFDRIGGFDTTLRVGEDADLAWRMQDQMGFSMAYSPDAVVYHRHQDSVQGLLTQRRGYGYGSVLLYLKYREQMGRRTFRHTCRDVIALGRRVGRCLGAGAAGLASWLRGRPDWEPAAMAALDVGSYLAWKLGQAQGSLRYHVWYV